MSLDKTTFDAPIDASPDGPRAYVSVTEGDATPPLVALPKNGEVAIGRSRSSAIFIDDGAVSRTHATLKWDGGGTVLLTDYGSRNGTLVDAHRVRGSTAVSSGSEIVVGGARMVLVIVGARTTLSGVVDDGVAGRPLARDPTMLRVIALAERAAKSDAPVLLLGETGVGKEVLARHVHAVSTRADRPFLVVAAGAVSPGTAEATLFGWERGAFTGAEEARPGIFEAVEGGTLFLDECAELSPATQARLLRVLQNKEVTRVGGVTPIAVDFRLVSATTKDITDEAIFRRDLLYRIATIRIDVPPLRERRDDVLPLADQFLASQAGGLDVRFAPDAIAALTHHDWPGNVRELENSIVRALAIRQSSSIRAHDLFEEQDRTKNPDGNLKRHVDDVERDAIVRALAEADGNQTCAAERLGISRRALIYRMEKLGLKAPPPSQRG